MADLSKDRVHQYSRAVQVAILMFAATRCVIFSFPDTAHSTMGGNLLYGAEAVFASQRNLSIYDLHDFEVLNHHRLNPNASMESADSGNSSIEYPPLVISWMALPIRLFGLPPDRVSIQRSSDVYIRATQFELLLSDILGLIALYYILCTKLEVSECRLALGLGTYALAGAALYPLIYDRMDIIVGMLLVVALAILLSSLPYWVSFAVLSLAINFKLVAVVVAPVYIIGSLPCSVITKTGSEQFGALARRSGVLALISIAMFVPYLLRDGTRSLAFVVGLARRGVQIESLTATLLLYLRLLGLPVQAEFSFGSFNVTAPIANTVALLCCLVTVGFGVWALRRLWRAIVASNLDAREGVSIANSLPSLIIQYSALLLVLCVCGSKVFSPQYILWFLGTIPLVVLKQRYDRQLQAIFVLVCLLTAAIYPVFYASQIVPQTAVGGGAFVVGLPSPLGLALLTARNLILLLIAVYLWFVVPTENNLSVYSDSSPFDGVRSEECRSLVDDRNKANTADFEQFGNTIPAPHGSSV